MSYGFHARPPFCVVAAVDAELGKPCEGAGKLDCNVTYLANIGISPLKTDVRHLTPEALLQEASTNAGRDLGRGDVVALVACPPCTDFSRAKPTNHLQDSPNNSLVGRSADLVEALFPEFVVMENARELIMGRNSHHYRSFEERLRNLGYDVCGAVHVLTEFGLPQLRERAVVLASRTGPVKGLRDLWAGWRVTPAALTVRHAIGWLAHPAVNAGVPNPWDPFHQAPGFESDLVRRRMEAIPADGGSWYDLADHPEADVLLIDSMKRRLARNDLGSHGDVYGRMAWDRPAMTVKRESAHVGNGRYAHPEQTRLLTVREMSMVQGFPRDYRFASGSLANNYRHIGDSVPPMVSYQLSALVKWMKTGTRPELPEWVLPGSCLSVDDVMEDSRNALGHHSELTLDTMW